MFPILFPRMLPILMSKVRDNLMPHVIADVVPLGGWVTTIFHGNGLGYGLYLATTKSQAYNLR